MYDLIKNAQLQRQQYPDNKTVENCRHSNHNIEADIATSHNLKAAP